MVLECTEVSDSFLMVSNATKIVYWQLCWFLYAAKDWSSYEESLKLGTGLAEALL